MKGFIVEKENMDREISEDMMAFTQSCPYTTLNFSYN